MAYYLAVDIGASSGRHIVAWVENGVITCEEVYRFPNGAQEKNGHLCWDVDRLFEEILNGLRRCAELGKTPSSMGVDTWGVDFVLLDQNSNRLGDAVAYRDSRTEGMDKLVEELLPFSELYERTGIQKLQFNTIYQLMAVQKNEPALLGWADKLLFLPDYFHYRLTGITKSEYTVATSSALVNAREKEWDWEIIRRLGFPERLFVPLSPPGEKVGRFTKEIRKRVGFDCEVILPASHDTASAFLAVPVHDDFAVTLSSGTWSLIGIENEEPLTGEESMQANFTNEGGYQYRFRYLKNLMGMWMIQSIRHEWNDVYSFDDIRRLAAECAEFSSVIDPEDSRFLAPKNMTEEVKNACRETGQPVPQRPGEVLQCVYRSMASDYKDAVDKLKHLTGKQFTAVHIVGGGSRDDYLNALTAKACGLPVLAGPTEASSLGNLLVQMIANGEFADLNEAREAVRNSFDVRKITR